MTILAAAAALSFAVAPTMAQARPAPVPQSAPASVPMGVTPQAAIDWMKGLGMTVGEPRQTDGRTSVQVEANGLAWRVFFLSCDPSGLCGDIQLTTALSNAGVTLESVNGWNRDRRFVKAIYQAPSASGLPSAVVQYDLLLDQVGASQLADAFAIWLNLLPEFVRTMTGAAPTPTPSPAN